MLLFFRTDRHSSLLEKAQWYKNPRQKSNDGFQYYLSVPLSLLSKSMVLTSTQARDLAWLDEKYVVINVRPVDMFPHTHHVENVVVLERRR